MTLHAMQLVETNYNTTSYKKNTIKIIATSFTRLIVGN